MVGRANRSLLSHVVLATVALAVQGCLTYRWRAVDPNAPTMANAPASGPIAVSPLVRPHKFRIDNASGGTVYVSPQRSTVSYYGNSRGLVSGDSLVVHADLTHADIPVAPGTSAEFSLYIPGEAMPEAPLLFNVAVLDDASHVDHLVVHVDNGPAGVQFTTRASDGDRIACYITGILYGGWCWFAGPGAEAKQEAERIAKERVGPAARVEYVGRE